MQPPDPPKAGEPSPKPEKAPGQSLADCFRAMEEELKPVTDPAPPEPLV
jgi:hypothetical protein